MEKAPSDSELQKWAAKTPPSRSSALATYYLARAFAREQKFDRAVETLGTFISANPGDPLLAEAYLLQGNIIADQQVSAGPDQQRLTPEDQQKLKTAIASFENAIKLGTGNEILAEAEMSCANGAF